MPKVALTVTVAALCSSCLTFWSKTPLEHARDLVPSKCRSVPPELTQFVLAKESIESVEPDLSYVITGGDHAMRLCGTIIHLRAIPHATTAGLIASAVGCHEARVTLGQPAPADDPYVLPGKWADITVWRDGNGFKVRVRGDDFSDGETLLDRARRYKTNRLDE